MCVLAKSLQSYLILWTVTCQAPLSMGFPGNNTGVPFSRGSFHPGIKPVSLMSPALVGGFFITSNTWETLLFRCGRV